MAISTLRTKRSRPMRLTGDLENSARNAASSSRASSASGGARAPRAPAVHFAARLRELVPRARRQAIVAAVDAIADRLAEFARDRSFVLDREIEMQRRASSRYGAGKHWWGRHRDRRGRCRSGPRRARPRQFERGEDRAEEQPRAELARDEIGVLALPAEARGIRQRLFHHGGSVDEHFHVAAGIRDHPARQRLEPALDHLVIVVALRIGRDRAAVALLQNLQRISSGP